MNNVTEKVSNKICTGCGACKNICKEKAVDAIEMRADNDGFYRPAAQGNCTGCGLCVKVCPAINPACDNETSPKCYAVMASDEIRMKSSSGGMFTLLADYVFEKGGYVCGAVFAEDFRSVYHAVTNDRRVFEKMRGNKYVQSDAGDSFFKIKTLLEQKEHVLFSGCPCQVAGLYAFLGRESRENLITVDLICHGVPSVKVWQKYLKARHQDKEIANCSMRGKDKIGWNGIVVDIVFKNGWRYSSPFPNDLFSKVFLGNYSLNQSCTACKYAAFPRHGDFSIGDFWGVDNYDKTLNDKLGTSVVFINNKKAAGILKNIENKCKLLTEIPVEATLKFNTINKCSPLNISRSYFFHHLDDTIFHALVEKISRNKAVYDVGIVGVPVWTNFGGALTYYALYKTIGGGGGGLLR